MREPSVCEQNPRVLMWERIIANTRPARFIVAEPIAVIEPDIVVDWVDAARRGSLVFRGPEPDIEW